MCTHPRTVRCDSRGPLSVHYIQVPCGKCDDCKKKYQNDWMVRLTEESTNWDKMLFLTLTYRSEVVPTVVDSLTGEFHYSVSRVHVQNWLKRFRVSQERLGLKLRFKYFITSEYGPRTFRPHYHCIIFGLDSCDFMDALHDWRCRYGFVSFSNVKSSYSYPRPRKDSSPQKVAYYVAKYCSKGSYENPYAVSGFVDKTFHLISKGIGFSYIHKFKDFHLGKKSFFGRRFSGKHFTDEYLQFVTDNRNVKIGDFKYHMPRYYKQKIYGTKNHLSFEIENFLFKKFSNLFDQQLSQLQASNPSLSCSEAFNLLVCQNVAEADEREKTVRASFARFYDRSKL